LLHLLVPSNRIDAHSTAPLGDGRYDRMRPKQLARQDEDVLHLEGARRLWKWRRFLVAATTMEGGHIVQKDHHVLFEPSFGVSLTLGLYPVLCDDVALGTHSQCWLTRNACKGLYRRTSLCEYDYKKIGGRTVQQHFTTGRTMIRTLVYSALVRLLFEIGKRSAKSFRRF
jgi:hypothetical protein